MTYIENARTALLDALGEPDWPADQERLLDLYTLLVLVKGDDVSLEDVHDAWAVARQRTKPDHADLVPFDDLAAVVQEWDQPFRKAIAEAGQGRTA